MNPILLVDDDRDDLMLIQAAMKQLGISRPVVYFGSGKELVEYLRGSSESPFLILCDVHLPGESGFTIKESLAAEQESLKYKSVPFIFWSTDTQERDIKRAYDLPAQGFFIKPTDFQDLCDTLSMIIGYWQKSCHPKSVK